MKGFRRGRKKNRIRGSFGHECILPGFLFILAGLFLSLPTSAQSIYVVNSTADHADFDLADQFCADRSGNCTLRAAIQNASKTLATDLIHLNIPGPAPHIIYPKDLPECCFFESAD